MSTRVDKKAAARQARLEAEAAESARVTRLRRLRVLGGVGLLALLVVVVAVAVGSSGGSKTVTTPKHSANLFAGIPQKGLTLGNPNAKATLEEFVDPQCPYCRQYSLTAFPTVVQNYVRTGKVKLVVRPLTFIGPQSQTAARTVVAAGLQNKAFPYLENFYANQGPENSGYVTDGFLRQLGGKVSGLNTNQALQAATSDAGISKTLATANARAKALGVNATPTLVLTVGKHAPQQLSLDANDYPGSVTSALNSALGT